MNLRCLSVAKYFMASLLVLNFVACSSSGDGTGSPEDYDLGEDSNIPLAGNKNENLSDINFNYDSSVLDDSAKQILKSNAKWIISSKSRVQVEGHCDSRGTADYNLALGERRAKSAVDYLRSLGVSSGNLTSVSYGAEIPLDPAQNESAYAKNRRAHFSLQK